MTDPQLQLAFHQAVNGMNRALAHANRRTPHWQDHAWAFLRVFCHRHALFISEDVSDAYREAGHPLPPTDRAWGPVYRRALRLGYISKVGIGRSRRRHGSICPLWRSHLCPLDKQLRQE